MTTLYLIRHSIKEKNYGIFDNNDSKQLKDEYWLKVSEEGLKFSDNGFWNEVFENDIER